MTSSSARASTYGSLEPERLLSEDECFDRFRRELLEGIKGTTVRAALIKGASNKAELTDWEQKVLRAAGRVQKETGVPVCLHSIEGARSQFDVLVKAGADPERLYFSHPEAEFGWEGRNLQEESARSHLPRQVPSFNNYEFEFDTPHEDLMYIMHYLLDRGYLDRMVFGMDVNFNIDNDGRVWNEAEKEHLEAADRTWEAIYTGFTPLVKRWGFTDDEIEVMFVDNPRRLFSTTRI
jgi:phosphotriesterase-related protein